MAFVDLFPLEMIEKIFSYLPTNDLASVSRVSVSWYIASNSSRLWSAAIERSTGRNHSSQLSDLDKFNRIRSNYDSDHSFNVDRPSTRQTRLPPMNPWKLSLCQHNFVESNLRGERPNFKLAQYEIPLEPGMEIFDLDVNFPSKSAQDGLYLPLLVGKPDGNDKIFYLLRLDGAPKFIQLFRTEAEIHSACIDRHGLVWMEHDKVNYLPLVTNFKRHQSKSLGSACVDPEDVDHDRNYRGHSNMDSNHIAVSCLGDVKIWSRKTFQLEMTITTEMYFTSFHIKNGYVYLLLSKKVQVYDINQNKLISTINVELDTVYDMLMGEKYYAIASESDFFSENLICVREVETNKVLCYKDISEDNCISDEKFWLVNDQYIFYRHGDFLNMFALFDSCLWIEKFPDFRYDFYNTPFDLEFIDDHLLMIIDGQVDVWDITFGKKLQEISMPQIMPSSHKYYVNEIRLVNIGKKSIDVVGFW